MLGSVASQALQMIETQTCKLQISFFAQWGSACIQDDNVTKEPKASSNPDASMHNNSVQKCMES